MTWVLQVTVARQTGAVTVWLVILAAAFLILVTIVRCMHMLTGLLLGITVSMGLLIAERTETHLIWPQVSLDFWPMGNLHLPLMSPLSCCLLYWKSAQWFYCCLLPAANSSTIR